MDEKLQTSQASVVKLLFEYMRTEEYRESVHIHYVILIYRVAGKFGEVIIDNLVKLVKVAKVKICCDACALMALRIQVI